MARRMTRRFNVGMRVVLNISKVVQAENEVDAGQAASDFIDRTFTQLTKKQKGEIEVGDYDTEVTFSDELAKEGR